MKRNIGFVIVFIILIYGLVQLHYCSIAPGNRVNTIDLKDIATIEYSTELKEVNNIPFSLLLDVEYKKNLPDTIDYEIFRPDLILLSKDFNEKDSAQLASFSNIIINGLSKSSSLHPSKAEYDDSKISELKATIEASLNNTSYHIIEWLPTEKITKSGTTFLKISYRQKNKNNGKITYMIQTSLLKNDKEIQVVLSTSDKDTNRWKTYYNEIINSIKFK